MKAKALNIFKSLTLIVTTFVALFSLLMFSVLGFSDVYAGESVSAIVVGYFSVFLITSTIAVLLLKQFIKQD